MRWIFFFVIPGALAFQGCDKASSRAEGDGGALVASAVPGAAAELPGAVDDTLPIVVRRAWHTTSSDLWSAPSADGRLLPITDWTGPGEGGGVAVYDLLTGETRRVTPGEDRFPEGYAENSVISPDGRRVAYAWWSEDRGWELRLVDIRRPGPRVLYHDPDRLLRPRQWSADGETVLVFAVDHRDNFIGLVDVTDGSLRALKRVGKHHPVGLAMSPDGRYVIYDNQNDGERQRDVYVIEVATGQERKLVEHPSDDLVLGWAPDGNHVLIGSDRMGTMGAWLLEVSGGAPVGSPRLIKPELWRADPLGFDGNGSFYYVVWMHMSDVFLATMDAATGQLVDRPARVSNQYIGSNSLPEWSPDGRRLAYFSERRRWREFGSDVIVIRSAETGEEKVLEPDLSGYMHPRWSPDGQSLLLRARDETGHGFFRIDVQTGSVEPLIRFPEGSGNIASRAEWIENGDALVYWWLRPTLQESQVSPDEQPPRTLRVRDLETGREEILHVGDISPRFALSPDRRQIAFSVREGGRTAIMAMSVEGGTPRAILEDLPEASGIGELPAEIQWSPDGLYLYYTDNASKSLWRVPVRGGSSERLDWFHQLKARPWLRFQPGGTRVALVCVEGEGGGELWVMENFLPGH